MTERRLFGRGASPGLASGPVLVLPAQAVPLRAADTPVDEVRALRQAIAAALVEVQALAHRAAGEAAEWLAFQVEMLSDDELTGSSLEAIRKGAGAHAAFAAAMSDEVEGYLVSGDEYFIARAPALQDLRDCVLRHLGPGQPDGSIPAPAMAKGAVVVASDLSPDRFLAMDWLPGGAACAIVLTQGSPSGHLAMLARARGVPMVVGVGGLPVSLAGWEALVDADAGEVVLDPGEAACAAFVTKRRAADRADPSGLFDRPAVTADGTRIALQVNIANLDEIAGFDPRFCDGIGVVRTELMFTGLADEATQYDAYCRLAAWSGERVVTLRAFDAGADPRLPGLALEPASNPFLGLRGIRWLLQNPGIFCTQLRAMARAAMHGPVRILLPMVTIPEELETARRLLDEILTQLSDAGVAARRPPLGMMIEVPAAAIAIDRFDADFFSIGSNDLTQYVMAAGRDLSAVAALADPLNPAVLRLVAAVAQHGRQVGCDVSLCGDAGADPAATAHLLGAGLRALSVPPAALARVRRAIAGVDLRVRPV